MMQLGVDRDTDRVHTLFTVKAGQDRSQGRPTMNAVNAARAIRAELKHANITGVKVTTRREHYGTLIDIDARWQTDQVEEVLRTIDLDGDFSIEW